MITTCIAIDIGASSGRLIAATFDGENINLEEIHRFSNDPVHVGENYYWDILRLFWEIKQGLKKANTLKIDSIGVDTWGVDYALFDKGGQMIAIPMHYRDSRNLKPKPDFPISKKDLYMKTGIQHLDFNTVYQLYSDKTSLRKSVINSADFMLMIPDVINFFLTGQKKSEYTNATTTQMLNPHTGSWDTEIISQLGLNPNMFLPIVKPCELYGYVLEDIIAKYGLNKSIPVFSVGSHDTASAVAGIPFVDSQAAFLSLGSWALLGKEIAKPIITEKSQEIGFSNEGGVFDSIRFLKNICGTFLLQRLRKAYNNDISFAEISAAAKSNKNQHFSIDPNHQCFVDPNNMITTITEYCMQHNQGKPETLGDFAIAVYNGLATAIAENLQVLEELTAEKLSYLHIVGGGVQDEFLCQHIANATNKKILAGPVESTIIGNVIMQLISLGQIKSLAEGRNIIRKSANIKEYIPHNATN
ncbi:MAG: rhamnulokinase [Alphaproteobacteria bacterium]|jgi:rhamnulokinase|nr:rhamnulokinase [Alphaproteobacteria bacterium]